MYVFWVEFELNFVSKIFIWCYLSTVWGCFINWPQKYPHFEKISILWFNVHIDFHIETTVDTTLIMPLTEPMNNFIGKPRGIASRTSDAPTSRTASTEIKRNSLLHHVLLLNMYRGRNNHEANVMVKQIIWAGRGS